MTETPESGKLRIFDGAAAIVTGAASGIGRALAVALARRGADVVLADRQIDLAQQAAAEICAQGGAASAEPVDVADYDSVDRVVQKTFDRRGRVDYLFNNAGISLSGPVRHYELIDWSRVLDVNLRGVVHGVQAVYPLMVEQGFGHIVNTASMAGLMPTPNIVGYAATKHAVVGLSKSLRIEAEAAGVRVSVLCPGFIRTPLLGGGQFGQPIERLRHNKPQPSRKKAKLMTADEFADRALRAIAKNMAIVVIPSWWKAVWWLERASPAIGLWIGRRILREVRKQDDATSGEKLFSELAPTETTS